jgi:PPOX class probable F420-dependent enzyme
MELAEALEHFRHNHRAVLVTRRRQARLQMSPVVQAVGNDGRVLISTRSGAMKVLNITRDPVVSICALNESFFGKWAQIDGTAAIVPMPEAMALLRFTYVQVAGEHPDWAEFERDMAAQGRVVIAIQPVSAGPDVAG